VADKYGLDYNMLRRRLYQKAGHNKAGGLFNAEGLERLAKYKEELVKEQQQTEEQPKPEEEPKPRARKPFPNQPGVDALSIEEKQKSVGKWRTTNYATVEKAMVDHYAKHGLGKTLEQYTDDAIDFWNKYNSQGKPWPLADGTTGIKLDVDSVIKGGIYTTDGGIITFWYD
jgi:hypothetical protein